MWWTICYEIGQKLNRLASIHEFHNNKPSYGTFWTSKILSSHPVLNLQAWHLHVGPSVILTSVDGIFQPPKARYLKGRHRLKLTTWSISCYFMCWLHPLSCLPMMSLNPGRFVTCCNQWSEKQSLVVVTELKKLAPTVGSCKKYFVPRVWVTHCLNRPCWHPGRHPLGTYANADFYQG